MEPLIHIIYVSTAKIVISEKVLHALIQKSRINNALRDVTGLLLSSEGEFFQVLEGEQSVVERLFEKIKLDPRHSNVILIIKEPIAKRDFEYLNMELAESTAQELAQVIATHDSVHVDASSMFSKINEGRAKKIIQSFSDGQWRKNNFRGQSKYINQG